MIRKSSSIQHSKCFRRTLYGKVSIVLISRGTYKKFWITFLTSIFILITSAVNNQKCLGIDSKNNRGGYGKFGTYFSTLPYRQEGSLPSLSFQNNWDSLSYMYVHPHVVITRYNILKTNKIN